MRLKQDGIPEAQETLASTLQDNGPTGDGSPEWAKVYL